MAMSRIERLEEKIAELEEEKGIKKKNKVKKPREFKIPFTSRISKSKSKQNYITVVKISENRDVSFTKQPIIEQTIMVDGIPRIAAGEYILNYKNKPLLILPSWSLEPMSPSKDFKSSLMNGTNAAGYKLILNRMQGEAIKLGKKIGGLGLSIGALIIAGVIAYALITG